MYYKYKYEIELRQALSKIEGISLINSTEPNMAKKIFGKHLSEAMGISMFELNRLGTDRDEVCFEDIILPYISFESDVLKQVLNRFKKDCYTTFKSFDVAYAGIVHNFGLGGLHSFGSPGMHKSDDNYVIKSIDVKSYYPNLIIRNKFCPEHIPAHIFHELYEGYYNQRINIPKSDPRNYIFKILLNSTYGLTNDKYSFLRDLKVTMQVTINGQLLLIKLAEMLCSIVGSTLIMCNTKLLVL